MKISKPTLFLSISLPLQVLLVRWMARNPNWIEHYYSEGIYPYLSKFFRIILGWIPFSIGDILGLYLLYLLCKGIIYLISTKFRHFIPKLLRFLSFLSVLHFCFYLFWGMNYFREPLAKKLAIQQSEYTTEQLYRTTEKIVKELNQWHFTLTQNDTISPVVEYTTSDFYRLAPEGFETLSKTYPALDYTFSSIKSSLVSTFQSYNGTSGYLNPITGEAQVNKQIPKTGFAATVCHEMAHQIGWAAENDANFIGFLASIHHSDAIFKYAGYRMAYQYCRGELYKRDRTLLQAIDSTANIGILKDFQQSRLHWNQYKNPIEPIFKKGYNSYLKMNNQSKGIDSYSYVVDLLIGYFEKQNNKHN